MQAIRTIYVYTEPKDQRVINWERKQQVIHSLNPYPKRVLKTHSLSLQPQNDKSGTIRSYLVNAALIVFLFGAFYGGLAWMGM